VTPHQSKTVAFQDTETPNQKVVATVTQYWKSIVESLPVPGYAWRWGEADLPFQCIYRLNEHDMLKQSEVGRKHWETTEQLWLYVISRASDDETVGCRIGQEVLDAPPDPDQEDTWRRIHSPPTGDQTDLTGAVIGGVNQDNDNLEQKLALNESKDPTWKSEEGGADPQQLTLVEVCALSQAGDVSTRSVGSFAQPAGQVYPSFP